MPDYVKDALHRLDQAGHIAYIVGGSVRDFFLEREAKDHDIATSALPDELSRLFPNAISVGKAFGVLKIPLPEPGLFLEIATFREDLEYRDHRHPEGVVFSGPEEDARRRDFTINALFYDPKTHRILDTVGGVADLQRKTVRAIGEPSHRFKEDSLRLLRAVRFATALGFEIELGTARAIRTCSKLVLKVSGERIRDELNQMITGPGPGQALQFLSEFGLLPHLLPELEEMKGVAQSPITHPEGDVWQHTLRIMQCLEKLSPKRTSTLAWGTLLHDVGKPVSAVRNKGKNFNGHEVDGAKMAHAIGKRLKLSRHEVERIVALIEDHLKFKDVFQMREATLQRWLKEPYFEELLILHRADAMASDGNLAFFEFCASRLEELRNTPDRVNLINGQDLIQLGFQPGPQFAQILRVVEDLAIERKLKSKDEALEFVLKMYVK